MEPASNHSGGNPEAAAESLIRDLQTLRHPGRVVLDLIGLGPAAIPILRRFLFRREPSGLYQPRCDAVLALAGLQAEDVLLEFLDRAPQLDISDPVERTGEDAVINAAARVLRHRRDDAVFTVLMRIAERRRLAGVIEALGEIGRREAIPRLIDGLFSDFTRSAAEAAIRKVGDAACETLIEVALRPVPNADFETPSSIRTRRSALVLLRDLGVGSKQWALLRPLLAAPDDWLAARACQLALATDRPATDREAAVHCLIRLLRTADWLLRVEIEGWLAENYKLAAHIIDEALAQPSDLIKEAPTRGSLLRVLRTAAPDKLSQIPSLVSGPIQEQHNGLRDGVTDDRRLG
jgi:hypothetical protein